MFFRVQVFQGPDFSGSRFFRVRIQVLEVAIFNLHLPNYDAVTSSRKLTVLYLNAKDLVIIVELKGKALETSIYRFNTAQ